MKRKRGQRNVVYQVDGAIRKTSILDLNTDCLREVFENLNPLELGVVGDVSRSFREIARAHFKTSKLKNLDFTNVFAEPSDVNSIGHGLTQISKVLRNFSGLIESISVKAIYFNYGYSEKFSDKLLALLSRDGHPKQLVLRGFQLRDHSAYELRPMLLNLRQLKLVDGMCSEGFIHMMSQWAPQLDTLQLHNYRMILYGISSIEAIEKFCIQNQQLKRIEIVHCANIGDRVLDSIVKYAPQIECLKFESLEPKSTTLGSNASHLWQLRNLKSLEIGCHRNPFSAAIALMAVASVPLEHLKLKRACLCGQIDQFVLAMKRLQQLKSLNLFGMPQLEFAHIREITTNLHELSELMLIYTVELTEKNLLSLIQSNENLRKLQINWNSTMKINIDGDTFIEIVNIVKARRQDIPLEVLLHRSYADVTVPESLAISYRHLLTVESVL